MADIKFSCSQCGQHISCDDLWSDHQIQCPACHTNLTVPHTQTPPDTTAAPAKSIVQQPPAATRPKLSAGLTQVTRSAPSGASAQKRRAVRPPKTQNPVLKYAVMAVLLTVAGVAAYNYLPALLSQAQGVGASKTPGATAAPAVGGVGPMGEVNGAMDVSDALDGSSPSRPRAAVAKPPATPATNTTAKAANRGRPN